MKNIILKLTAVYDELDNAPITEILQKRLTELDMEISYWDLVLRDNMKPGEEDTTWALLLRTQIDAMRAYALVLQERIVYHTNGTATFQPTTKRNVL